MSEKLISLAKARFDYESNKKVLKEKYEAKMTFASAGGLWKASPELLTTLLVCPDDEAVILDTYGTPIKVNVKELYAETQQRWQEQMNAWLVELNSK